MFSFFNFLLIVNAIFAQNKDPIQDEFIDPCSLTKCSSNQICVAKDNTSAICVNEQEVQLKNTKLLKRQIPTFCGSNECRFGDCETFNSTTFICHCQAGITGESCNKLDTSNLPCSSNPCYGNSVCVNLGESYVCVCGPGRTGKDCRDHASPCQCQNGGICISVSEGAFRCKCLSGYGGHLCQYQVTPFLSCKITGCHNNGICTVFSKCQCPPKYTGFRCETLITTTRPTTTKKPMPKLLNINVCYVGICQNGGTCYQLGKNSGICICSSGYSGPYCSDKSLVSASSKSSMVSSLLPKNTPSITKKVDIRPCPSSIPNPCQNNGQCGFIESTNTITCNCASTYQGPFCNIRVPFCEKSPCKNGGTCIQIDKYEGYCTCLPNFTGFKCDISLTCDPNPCNNNQPCLVVNGVAKCFCASRFRPPYCD